MSAYNYEKVLAPWEAHRKALVREHTWGHLAPVKEKEYEGRIVYAVGCFGSDNLNPTPLFCEFDELNNSPWFFDYLNEFLQEQDFEVGCVYEFCGSFKNYSLEGQISLVYDTAKKYVPISEIESDLTNGEFCRYVEHAQDHCGCEEIHKYFREISAQEAQG